MTIPKPLSTENPLQVEGNKTACACYCVPVYVAHTVLVCCQAVELCVHIFHGYIFTPRGEFGEISWPPIRLSYRGHALLCFAPFCVFLETWLPCRALPGPRDNSQYISVSVACANKCLRVYMCVYSPMHVIPLSSFWFKFVTQSMLNTKHLCLLNDIMNFSSLL